MEYREAYAEEHSITWTQPPERTYRLFATLVLIDDASKIPPDDLKPRANGRNIVGCYMLRPFAHAVACCCAKFKTGQTFQPTTPNISLIP